MEIIQVKSQLYKIGKVTVLRLPQTASAKLPSRGITMVKGTINGFKFQAALEPDGKGSHWLEVDAKLRKGAGIAAGDTATLAIESTKEWTEPVVPQDLQNALGADTAARDVWIDITPMARWDWIRWINATSVPTTRQRRIEVGLSKLKHGTRRPCCFNRNMCTVPEVSKNGALLDPTQTAPTK